MYVPVTFTFSIFKHSDVQFLKSLNGDALRQYLPADRYITYILIKITLVDRRLSYFVMPTYLVQFHNYVQETSTDIMLISR